MTSFFRPRSITLFLGDISFFALALWASLFLRSFEVPSLNLLWIHAIPFAILFGVWTVVYLIAGLYEKRISLFQHQLPKLLLKAQIANVILAALFFFTVPYFGITPKTLLVIYLIVSFLLVGLWRIVLFPRIGKDVQLGAVVVGAGSEVAELVAHIRASQHSPIRIDAYIDIEQEEHLEESLLKSCELHKPGLLILDTKHPKMVPVLPSVYKQLIHGVSFMDVGKVYEEVFERVPLSLMGDQWVVENISQTSTPVYDALKRLVDVVGGLFGAVLSLPLYPFIALAIQLDSKGPIFISQGRIGKGGSVVNIHKFRTMTGNDGGQYQGGATALRVTRVGAFLRVTRLDEIPQLFNVLGGHISLIGPRPELPALVSQYEKEIPYYGVRHLIKPGLSGWAQLYQDNHPHHALAVEATKEKLSYDLYYLKRRSLMLDIIIVLKTIRKLLTRSGS